MNLDKLKQQRETLKTKLAAVEAKIAKAEREFRERDARELVKLIQSRGLSAAQISQLLAAAPGGEGETKI